jgi:peptidoglycan/xylan/chitin deacetylase (PgdA/CDA1 family)
MRKWSILLSVPLALVLLLSSQPAQRAHSAATLADIPDKTVTLTFDDGPDPRFTPHILDILKKHHVHGTFFVVGKNALAHPELVRRMAAEGHTVANHTLTHPHLEQLNTEQVRAELQGGDAALTSVLGPTAPIPHFFRPPRGKETPAIHTAVQDLHKQTVLWNVCVENHATRTPQEVRDRVLKLIGQRHGGILLAHDGELDRTLTLQSLPLILDALDQEGYQIVPLPEYLAARAAQSAARADKR